MTTRLLHACGIRMLAGRAARLRRSAGAMLLAALIACASMPASAQSCGPGVAGSPCATGQVAGMDSTGGVDQAAGNPINIITGNKYQLEADMPALPGVLGLELVRHYNSRLAAPGMPLQGIGHGWQLSYDTRLHALGDTLQIVQADGARIIFGRSAWRRSLCTTADPAQGLVRILRDGGRPAYRWSWPNGRELFFDHNGRLTRIADSSGMAVRIERLADGRISAVTDPQGRSMTFHYLHRNDDAPGRYRGVQSVDTPVGRFLYDYGDVGPGSANLSAVHLPTQFDPARPRPPFRLGDTPASSSVSTLKRLYHYRDSRFPTLLTGISVEGAGTDGKMTREWIARWGYDDDGLAVLSIRFVPGNRDEDGKVVPVAEQLTFERSEPGLTRILDGHGRLTFYRHAIVAGAFRLLEARGAGCASCGPVNVRYRYDGHGRLEEVIRLDATGLPVEGRRQKLDAHGRLYAMQRVSYRHGRQSGVEIVLRQQYAYPGLPVTWPRSGGPSGPFGPARVAANSVVQGRTHEVGIEYNQRQQPVLVTETGFNPVTGSPTTRITRYRYQETNGRSLLVEIDGPLPNGPTGTPADSDITRYEWDQRGAFVIRIVQPMGVTLDFTHDAYTGRPQTVRYRWDDIVRLSRYDYGSNGQITRHRETAYAADGTTVLAERETSLESNARNQISGIAWPGGRAEQAMRRMPGLSGPTPAGAYPAAVGMPEVLRYDIDGKSAQRLIDDFGQVVGIRNPGQGWQYATYDEAGRISELRDARGMLARVSHDAAGRLLNIVRQLPGDAVPERLDFSWHGPYKASETVSMDSRPTHAAYYLHTPWGQVSQKRVEIAAATLRDRAVSMTMQSTHDAAGRLSARTLPGGERLAYRYYATDPYHGQRAAIEQIHWPRWLDGLMTDVPEPWLDRSGLKTRLVDFAPQEEVGGPGSGAPPALADGRPQAEPGLGKDAPGERHDAAGLPQRIDTAKGSFVLRWNAASQLVSVRSANAGESSDIAITTYDAHGRRASKRSAAGVEYYFYEGTQLVAVQSMPLHGPSRIGEYLYEGYRPVTWLRDGIAMLLQTDHRGAVSAVTSAEPEAFARKTLWRGDPGPWGRNPAPDADADASSFDPRLRLVNQFADEETGLSYHIARYYDPARGRFISPDPAGIADTMDRDVPDALRLDLTAYAAGQPSWYFDPDGAARLIYYAITTGEEGKQLGATQGFTKARWAFSVDGIEASGDGGSDAVNRLMEKYAKDQTGLLFDKGGNFIAGKKNAVSWNGASDETVDGFTSHYRADLISMRQFVIADYSNMNAALLIASLMKDKDGENLCKDIPGLLPQIRFGAGEDNIVVTRPQGVDAKSPANLQRIVNCEANRLTSLPISYADDLERERVERIEAAAEMNESSALNKDCSKDGCPGVTIFGQPGENGESAREYHASYGRSQFVAATFIETLDNLPAVDKAAIGITSDLQRRITLARKRARTINDEYGVFAAARKFSCPSAQSAWDDAGGGNAMTISERSRIQFDVALDRQNFIDMVCFVPEGKGKTEGEAKNAFMTESIFSDSILRSWLMNLYKSYDPFNLVSRTFIRNNLRKVLGSSELTERLKNREPKESTNAPEISRFETRQREIEDELGMRTARLHNGGGGGLTGDKTSLTRTCVKGEKIPCDTGDYVKTFIGIKAGRGDWRSLRCGELGNRRGMQILPLKL